MPLSHINEANEPTMVDVGAKAVSRRTACAEATLQFPDGVLEQLRDTESGAADKELHSRKGPVHQTAILAGIMAAKKTSELIPLCHLIPLENCSITIEQKGANQLRLRCEVCASHKTGVEMEALTGVSVAALTIYDMCKALSHGIEIQQIRLVSKTGGKKDIQ